MIMIIQLSEPLERGTNFVFRLGVESQTTVDLDCRKNSNFVMKWCESRQNTE